MTEKSKNDQTFTAREEKSKCTCGCECCGEKKRMGGGGAAGGGLYGLGFLGAAIYFIAHATTFWLGVLGFLKALVWPAFLIFKLLEFLNM